MSENMASEQRNGFGEFPDVEAETSFEVQLYIYDLSKGLARNFSQLFLGKQLPGIWHTSIVAYGREYFFGSAGIESCGAGETILGEPDQIMPLGKTELPYSVFLEYIFSLGESSYRPGTYDLFTHNCNNFTQDVASFITGKSIPSEILHLPDEVLSTPLGGTLKTFFDTLNLRAEGSRGLSFGPQAGIPRNPSPSTRNSNGGPPEAYLNGGIHPPDSPIMADGETTSAKSPALNPEEVKAKTGPQPVENMSNGSNLNGLNGTNGIVPANGDTESISSRQPEEDVIGSAPDSRRSSGADGTNTENGGEAYTSRKTKRYKDPPIIYSEGDGTEAMKKFSEQVKERLNEEEKQALQEFDEYLSTENGAWALGATHLDLIGRILSTKDFTPEMKVLLLQVLKAAALKEDIILLLHQDRKDHRIMGYINRIEDVSPGEQDHITQLLCNMCNHPSSFDWLMYISEWEQDGYPCSNCRVTVRAAVHSLLSDRPALQEVGTALMYNLALKELFDDTATELATAVLQYLHADLQEEAAFRTLTALLRFLYISYNDVPALMKMLGPDVNKFKGTSSRVDEVLEQINFKLSVSISA